MACGRVERLRRFYIDLRATESARCDRMPFTTRVIMCVGQPNDREHPHRGEIEVSCRRFFRRAEWRSALIANEDVTDGSHLKLRLPRRR